MGLFSGEFDFLRKTFLNFFFGAKSVEYKLVYQKSETKGLGLAEGLVFVFSLTSMVPIASLIQFPQISHSPINSLEGLGKDGHLASHSRDGLFGHFIHCTFFIPMSSLQLMYT